MKILVEISRILVGLLFVFSGFIKSNDPLGFSYKLEEYFSVFSADLTSKQDSLSIELGTGSDFQTKKYVLDKSKPKHLLSWHVAIDTNDTRDQQNELVDRNILSTLEILLDNQLVFQESFINKDSNTILFQAFLKANILDKELTSKEISVLGFQKDKGEQEVIVDAHLKSDIFLVEFFQQLKPYALLLAIFLVVFEIILGVALLIGFLPKLTTLSLLIVIVLFTFLTWYSATYDKVTDCGCFGDAIPLKPFQSFVKDLILLVLILILFVGRRYIHSIFKPKISANLIALFLLLSTGFAIRCWYDLPVLNFLKYKEGNNLPSLMQIPEGGRKTDHILRKFLYKNAQGEEIEITYDSETNRWSPQKDENWTFVSYLGEEVMAEADKAPIHDFRMDDESGKDHLGSFFEQNEFKILLVSHDLELFNVRSLDKVNALHKYCVANKIGFWALTANSQEEAKTFEKENHLSFSFHFGDNTNLKSIIRSNPGILLLKKGTVVKTWSARKIPSKKILEKYLRND